MAVALGASRMTDGITPGLHHFFLPRKSESMLLADMRLNSRKAQLPNQLTTITPAETVLSAVEPFLQNGGTMVLPKMHGTIS